MKKIALLLVLFALLIVLVLNQNFKDIQISKYETIEEVKKNNAIKEGWIPAILPESAFEIVESHELDTQILYGSFKYKEKDEERFMKNLISSSASDEILTWGNFLFKVDKKENIVKFKNRSNLTSKQTL